MASLTVRQTALKHGFRSGLEDGIAAALTAAGVPFEYEPRKLAWTKPATQHTYTPDFWVQTSSGHTIVVETKGRFLVADRQKMERVIAQHPDLDFRFVFSNASARISKKSKTTYAAWCDKRGYRWAHKAIPKEWLDE
jgi:hypothetical protein